MTISILGRKFGSSLSERGTTARVEDRTLSVEYILQSDNCEEDEANLLDVVGLPKIGDRSDVYPDMYVTGRSYIEGEGDGLYTVNIEYSILTASSSGDQPNDPYQEPWQSPVRVSYSTKRKPSLKTKMIYLGAFQFERATDMEPTTFSWNRDDLPMVDEDGNRVINVTNSAGSPIYYDGERILRVVELSFAATIFETEKWLRRVNTVNKNQVFISELYPVVKPGQALLDDFRADRKIHVYPNGFRELYYECQANVVLDPLGHWVEFADVGTYYFDGGVRLAEQNLSSANTFLNSDGEPTTSELNGRGGAKASYEDVWFLKYVPYPVRNW